MFEDQETSQSYEIVEPNASALSESLRAFGYTPQAAVADLIDNSITAEARNIWIDFEWDGPASYVTIRDDGCGMSQQELVAAMRPGSQSPLEQRGQNDLGRFGLGLKTASFSQCRCLTVSSKQGHGPTATRRWNLDYVNATSEWRLLTGAAPGSEDRLAMPEQVTGTCVLWENLDRLVDAAPPSDEKAQKRFLELIVSVEGHIAMTFHRFLSGRRSLAIWVNSRKVEGWDPFLEHEPATQHLPMELLKLHDATIPVRPYVLPHHSKIDQETHKLAAGIRGWNAQQGFYIYRNQRLLVAGDWLGLGFQKEEHYKLARIAIDLPNTMDQDWDLDVRKSRARPPGILRDALKKIARLTRERAAAVYRYRGKLLIPHSPAEQVFLWNRLLKHGTVSYRINNHHPLVVAVLEAPDPYRRSIQALLHLIEETVPIPLILIDGAENPKGHQPPFKQSVGADVLEVMMPIYEALRARGLDEQQAQQRLLGIEPFGQFPELVAALVSPPEMEVNA